MKRLNNLTKSEFYCVKCGNKGIPIQRQKNKEREQGHLKKLYCPFCQVETNHVEVREKGKYNEYDFRLEFTFGNFDEDGNRIKPFKQFRREYFKGLEGK